MKLLHNASRHDGIDESHFFGQLFGSERIFDGDVLLVIVEQSLGSGECWLGKVGKRITNDQSERKHKKKFTDVINLTFKPFLIKNKNK